MEALPPPPPAEIVYHDQQVPQLSDPVVIETSGSTPPIELITLSEPAQTEQQTTTDQPLVETVVQPEVTKFQKIRQKIGQIALGESVGTAFDVLTMAAGVPLPLREVAGSALDTKIYGSALEQTDNTGQEQSRAKTVGKKVGSIAMFAATGMVAQKYGSELANGISSHLNHGVFGEYITPLASKFGAMTGVNSAVRKIIHS